MRVSLFCILIYDMKKRKINLQYHLLQTIMSLFSKGDFKIQESWKEKPKSKDSQRGTPLINAGRNVIQSQTDILDDEISQRIIRQFKAEIPSSEKVQKKTQESKVLPPKAEQKKGVSSSINKDSKDNDLLASMAARLKTVELTCKSQRQQIKQKNNIIDKLKNQNTFYKGMREDATAEYAKVEQLTKDKVQLQEKVNQMTEYLKKYGLKWVGNKLQGSFEDQKLKKDIKKPAYNYRLPSEIDLGTIMRRVQDLNGGLHSQGQGTEIYNENGIHKFKPAQPLPIGFFKEGIAIKGFNFFPYKCKQSLQILSDILDGYFPYVLKQKYPNGVFLKVVDKIAQSYDSHSSEDNINSLHSREQNVFKPPSKEQFLNKLPQKVIKNGKVINIRSEIQKRFNGETDIVDNNNVYQIIENAIVFKTGIQADKITACTLKVRDQSGKILIIHLQKTNVMKDVYIWVRKVVKQNFQIMGHYPHRTYLEGQDQNLEQLGLYPNAMLHIKLI